VKKYNNERCVVSENSLINGRKKTKIENKKYASLSKSMKVRVH
jgi:hypothetical protein